jgi:hypothetical protein
MNVEVFMFLVVAMFAARFTIRILRWLPEDKTKRTMFWLLTLAGFTVLAFGAMMFMIPGKPNPGSIFASCLISSAFLFMLRWTLLDTGSKPHKVEEPKEP